MECPIILEPLFDGLAKASPWNGAQAWLWDRFAGNFTEAVSTGADAIERGLNFVQHVLFAGQLAQGEIMLEIFGREVRRIERFRGCDRLSSEARAMIQQTLTEREQSSMMPSPLRWNLIFGNGPGQDGVNVSRGQCEG